MRRYKQAVENTGPIQLPRVVEAMTWDLTDLYDSPTDPQLTRDMEKAVQEADRFAGDFRGRIHSSKGLSPGFVAEVLRRYEDLLEIRYKTVAYARLLHSADTGREGHGALLSKALEVSTRVQTRTMFFELDWIALDDESADRISRSPECSRWSHFLTSLRRYKPHTLSEKEEIILAERNQTGRRAFQRLFDESTSSQRFQVRMDGKKRSLNQSEALALLHNPDRRVRRAAHRGFTRGLSSNIRMATYVVNTLVQDHGIENRLRSYSDPEQSRHLSNEIDASSVHALLSACESQNHLVERYYLLKSRMLGISPLYDYDRYAPVNIQGAATPHYEWQDACNLVRESYARFSPLLGSIVQEFFEKRWIDSQPRDGKRGGAFCSPTVPSVHPYVLMNYSGRLNDVMTLAHELGHGVHQYLAGPRGIIQCTTPLTLAETASVFGEMLVFDRLVEDQKDPRVRLALYCNKLEDSFATVFRQVALTRFEQRIHRVRAMRELSAEELGEIWIHVNKSMMGKSIRLTRGYRIWWSYIGHFVHVPFYCYAYAFGELLVLSLWRQFQREGRDFVPRYLRLLEAGGSEGPADLVAKLNQDIDDTRFWTSGLSVLEEILVEAEKLAGGLGF